MATRKGRLTLGRLMAAIGVVALGIAISRVDAAPAVSVCVFVGCTWYLAARRYAESLGRIDGEQGPVGPARRARIAARCVLGAAMAIGLPDAAFLGGYYGYMAVLSRSAFRETDVTSSPELELMHILAGALVGIGAALYVAAIMRRGLGPRPAARKRVATPADRANPAPGRPDERGAIMRVPVS